MKKTLLLTASAALLWSNPVVANGLRLAWTACPSTTNATTAIAFDCDPNAGSVYDLIGTFSLTNPAPNIAAMDGIVDMRFEGETDVPPFWQFQAGGGCNESGLLLIDARPIAAATGCSAFANTLCAAGGTACDAFLTGYGVNYSGPGTGRLLFTLARAASNPTTLAAEPTQFFGFDLQFMMDNAGTCAGCNTPTSIVWNMALLHTTDARNGDETVAAILSSTDPLSAPCANANGGTLAGCGQTPTRRGTWGSLKSLYR